MVKIYKEIYEIKYVYRNKLKPLKSTEYNEDVISNRNVMMFGKISFS